MESLDNKIKIKVLGDKSVNKIIRNIEIIENILLTEKPAKVNRILLLTLFLLIGLGVFSCSTTPSNKINPEFSALMKKTAKEINYVDTANINRLALDYVIRGSNLQQEGRHAEAILEFQDALKYDSSASIYYAIAKSYKELYKFGTALTYSMKAMAIDSTFIPVMELMADVYIMQYRPDDAATVYEQIVKLKPSKYNTLSLARLYEINKPKKAIELYEETLKSGEDNAILIRLSALYEQTKNEEMYLSTLERLYRYNPDNSRAMLPLLETYLKMKFYDKAFDLLKKINTSVQESDLDIYLGFVGNYLADDTSSKAENNVSAYLNYIDNRFFFNWRLQLIGGLLAGRIKDTVRSEKFLLHALDLADTIPDIPLEVAIHYAQQKNYAKSIKFLNDYELKFPKDWRFSFYIGLNNLNLKNDRLAANALLRSMSLDSTRFDTYIQLGMAYDRLKLFDSTMVIYEKALKINPKEPTLNNNYAYTLSEQGKNLDKALEMIQYALSVDSNNASFLDTYAWVLFKLGRFDESVEYINKAIKTGDVHAEVFEHLGDIYIKMGKKEEAVNAWQKGLILEKDNAQLLDRISKNK